LALLLPDGMGFNVLGQIVAVLGVCLLCSAVVAHLRLGAGTQRGPRRGPIDDDGVRSGHRPGSTRRGWAPVRRGVGRPEVYLLYQSESMNTATFDIPRDTLTPDQDGEIRALLAARGLLPEA